MSNWRWFCVVQKNFCQQMKTKNLWFYFHIFLNNPLKRFVFPQTFKSHQTRKIHMKLFNVSMTWFCSVIIYFLTIFQLATQTKTPNFDLSFRQKTTHNNNKIKVHRDIKLTGYKKFIINFYMADLSVFIRWVIGIAL